MMSKKTINNPSLTLYAFHLRADAEAEVTPNAAHLWEKFAQLSEVFSAPQLRELTDKLICYQKGQYKPQAEPASLYLNLIQTSPHELRFSLPPQKALNLNASVYPLKLHDVYAVDFTLFCENQTVEINQLHHFNPQGALMPNRIEASLGETLLFYAEPAGNGVADQSLADECVRALLQGSQQSCPSCIDQILLFGSPLFVYETLSPNNAPSPNESTRILVWLGQDEETVSLATQANPWLINLLSAYHKIQFTYFQAAQSNQSAHQLYKELGKQSQQFSYLSTEQKVRLRQLESLLSKMPQAALNYAKHLRDLEDHRTTIETNAENYGKWLSKIRQFALATDELTFWETFQQQTSLRYQQQISIYLNYLKSGHQLFGQMIETIRGMVEIEGQKLQTVFEEKQRISDRRLQFLIAFIGVAVGVGAISATVIPNPVESFTWLSDFQFIPTAFVKVLFHLIVGGGVALILSPFIRMIAKWFD
jgi:hypothetical protein